MRVHELKSWPREFSAARDGRKRFEVRRNDRGFDEGDVVILREFVPEHLVGQPINQHDTPFKWEKAGYTGASCGPFRIGYVTECSALPDGWVGFELIKLVCEAQS